MAATSTRDSTTIPTRVARLPSPDEHGQDGDDRYVRWNDDEQRPHRSAEQARQAERHAKEPETRRRHDASGRLPDDDLGAVEERGAGAVGRTAENPRDRRRPVSAERALRLRGRWPGRRTHLTRVSIYSTYAPGTETL